MMDMFEWKSEAHARGVSHWIKINKDVEIALDNFNNLRKDFYRFSLIINGDHAIYQCNLTADSWEDAETMAIQKARKCLLSEKKFWTQAYGDFENLRLEE
jgi:hypothetical protein